MDGYRGGSCLGKTSTRTNIVSGAGEVFIYADLTQHKEPIVDCSLLLCDGNKRDGLPKANRRSAVRFEIDSACRILTSVGGDVVADIHDISYSGVGIHLSQSLALAAVICWLSNHAATLK